MVLDGKDVIVQSQTGTGKTAAFLIPILQLCLDREDRDKKLGKAKALIVSPTRELAIQIKEEAEMLGKHLPFRYEAFYGGVGYKGQETALEKGVDLIIGTPGRLLDFERSKKLDFSNIDFLIVDEADRLFDMGFYPDLQSILSRMKSRYKRRTLLFSATMGTRVMNLAWEHMNEPAEVKIEPEHITVETIKQELYHVLRDEKLPLLLGLFKRHRPSSAIIFTNTKRAAEELAERLRINGYRCEFIIGDLPQSKRTKVIGALKRGELQFLVATDVAARGLHVDDLELVVNWDLPEDAESYVHRIGRTARAGRSGVAASLADERYVYGLPAIEKLIGFKIPLGEVDEGLFAEDASAGMRIRLQHAVSDRDPSRKAARPQAGGRGSGDRSRGPRGPKPSRPQPPRPREARPLERKPQADARPAGSRNYSSQAGAQKPKTRSRMSQEERIEYYKKKYGDNFDPEKAKGRQRSRKQGSSAAKGQPQVARERKPAPGGETLKAVHPPKPQAPKKKGFAAFLSKIFGKTEQ